MRCRFRFRVGVWGLENTVCTVEKTLRLWRVLINQHVCVFVSLLNLYPGYLGLVS